MMRAGGERRRWAAMMLAGLGLAAAGCGGTAAGDGKLDEVAPPGKADGLYGACEVAQVVAYANDPASTVEQMKADGVYTRAAENIAAVRNGPDGLAGSDDDHHFADIAELDAVYYVGPKTMDRLVAACKHRCWAVPEAEVIFSPQPYGDSHLERVAALIDGARRSIDVAMYSFRDHAILDALARAVARGVQVRFVFEKARDDRSEPDGGFSAELEQRGVDVRYINKIMHHKFAIIDGPVDSLDAAYSGTLISGSGNWSYSAATRYDENTVIISGHGELLLRFQMEFNHVWANSRDFVWEDFTQVTTKPIGEHLIVDDAWAEALFTSANFDTYVSSRYGPTFSVMRGSNTVSDRLLELIAAAEQSIHIASGHLRSRPVAEALMARQTERPEMDIRVYLDNQEYISRWYDEQQQLELLECLDEAGDSEAQIQDCYDKGYYFSYPLVAAGIAVRFKSYCYRWHYSYAAQMHHKVLIFDGRILATGSYNLSDNAEHNTIENIVIYHGERFGDLVERYEANFEQLWRTGRDADGYGALLDEIENGSGPFPIVFEPMALDWTELTALKQAIREHCPDIDSDAYRQAPEDHTTCER